MNKLSASVKLDMGDSCGKLNHPPSVSTFKHNDLSTFYVSALHHTKKVPKKSIKSMHSSGMRTARLLTVSQHALCRGVYPSMQWARGCLPRGVSAWGSAQGGVCPGVSAWGVSAQGGEADTAV